MIKTFYWCPSYLKFSAVIPIFRKRSANAGWLIHMFFSVLPEKDCWYQIVYTFYRCQLCMMSTSLIAYVFKIIFLCMLVLCTFFISFSPMKNVILILSKSGLNSVTARFFIYLKYVAYMTSMTCTGFFAKCICAYAAWFVQYLYYFIFKNLFSV